MTKAGSKSGNLRDKLDGNELDLSLSDLNEVPVKELVSTAPRGLDAPLAGQWLLRGLPVFKTTRVRARGRGLGDVALGDVALGDVALGEASALPEMYTCHFGAVPEVGSGGKSFLGLGPCGAGRTFHSPRRCPTPKSKLSPSRASGCWMYSRMNE